MKSPKMGKTVLLIPVLVLLMGFAVVAVPTSAYSSTYGSLVPLSTSWSGCGNVYRSAQMIISVPSTPASYVTMSWSFPASTPEGVFGICYNQGFTALSGFILDFSQGWVQALVPPIFSSSGQMVYQPLLSGSIGTGDMVGFSFTLTYGVWTTSMSYVCYNFGQAYGTCTSGA